MVAAERGRLEVGAGQLDAGGRTVELRLVERALPAAGAKVVERLDLTVARLLEQQAEATADVGVGRVGNPAVAEDVTVAGLVGPDRTFLDVGGLERTRIAGVTRVADLVGEVAVPGEGVAREEQRAALDVVVVEHRQVGVEAAVELGHRQLLRQRIGRVDRAARHLLEEVDDADLDVLLGVGTPEPRPTLPDRTATLDAVVLDVLDRRAGAGALRAQFLGQVGRTEFLIGDVVARRATDRVAAALGHEVDADAAGLLRDVVAARADLQFLEHVEVVVHGRGAGGRLVGDVHAVERPLVVGGRGAARDVARLLARLAAAHVGAVHRDARRALEHDPRVARRRHVLQLLLREVGLGARLAGVDQRRFTRDRDALLERRDLQRRVGRRVAAGVDLHALDHHRAEAGQLEADRVARPRLEAREQVRARLGRGRRQRLNQGPATHRHHDTGEDRPGCIHHPTHDIAGRGLRHRWRRPEDQAQRRQQGEQSASHPCLLESSDKSRHTRA